MNPLALVATLALGSPPVMKSPPPTCSLRGTLVVTDPGGHRFVPEYAEVYVDTRLPMPPRLTPREMKQKGRAFDPRILVVELEDTVVFSNLDPWPHEIHSEKIKNTFMSGLNQKPETFRREFTEVGESTLGCRIHPGMSGTILTVPNVFHVKVADDGSWSLSGLPAQPLKLIFWQRTGLSSAQTERTLTPCTDTAPVEVTLSKVPRAKPPPYGGRPTTD